MDFSKVIWLVVFYFVLSFIGRYPMKISTKKLFLTAAIMCKILIFTMAFVAVFASGIFEISEIFQNGDISNLSASDAAILIGVLLAILDIIDSFFEWTDIILEK